jgi:hypothetical protein
VHPPRPYKTQLPTPLPRFLAQTTQHHPTNPQRNPRAEQLLSHAERELSIPARLEEKGGNGGYSDQTLPPFSTLSLFLVNSRAHPPFSSVQEPLSELIGSSLEPPLFKNDAELPAMSRHHSDKAHDNLASSTTTQLIHIAANFSDEP